MRRFHVHVSVDDIQKNVAFYSTLFGPPTRVEPDYVKWMLEDPRINFAISKRGSPPGVNHLGIQVDSDEELQAIRGQLEVADAGLFPEPNSSCCYAKSDKYWVTDPQGIAWETFRTLGAIPTFGGERATQLEGAACCAPSSSGASPSCGQKATADESRKDCCA